MFVVDLFLTMQCQIGLSVDSNFRINLFLVLRFQFHSSDFVLLFVPSFAATVSSFRFCVGPHLRFSAFGRPSSKQTLSTSTSRCRRR
jgi:hypothetical protein